MIEKNARMTGVVKSDYDRNATNYDRVRFGSPGGQYVNEKEQEFLAWIVKSSIVLEIGTATGRFAATLAKKGVDYTGVDISRNMLQATYDRVNRAAAVIQMDGCQLGLRQYFDYVLCIRTFHFLPDPVEALKGMYVALKPSGKCLVTFETDNPLRRFLVLSGLGNSEQYYYKKSEVEYMFLNAGFKLVKSGAVMHIPVTFYRKCPKPFLRMLKPLERLWPWSMHDYVLGEKRLAERSEKPIETTVALVSG